MRYKISLIVLLSSIMLISCKATSESLDNKANIEDNTFSEDETYSVSEDYIQTEEHNKKNLINSKENTIENRFLPPEGFERTEADENTFAHYLRTLTLKPHGSLVHYYDGDEKNKKNVYIGVVDMDIGDRDLQQCADAVMRLRGEYLYNQGLYDQIHFNFTNGFKVDYTKWMQGYRIKVDGNTTQWEKVYEESNDYEDFRKYMDIIFAYAGTLSLSKELQEVEYEDMQIGDVLIQGGTPGHAVIVVDMVENKQTDERLYMLAQSYMPAQDIQILINPSDEDISPWYSLDKTKRDIITPEWFFETKDLKRFEE